MIESREARAVQPAKPGLPTQIVLSSSCLLSVKFEDHDGQSGIATIRVPVNLNDEGIRICRTNRKWLRQIDAIPRFVGCSSAERCMWSMLVVPIQVTVHSPLERTNTDRQDCQPEPDSQRPEQSLDFAVERTAGEPCP